jgi:hypothetical protein
LGDPIKQIGEGDVPELGIDDGGFCWLLRVFGSFWRGREEADPILEGVVEGGAGGAGAGDRG